VNKLFIDLYLDEDVDVLVARLIGARGFNALTAQESYQLGKSDEEQLEFASNRESALLTHNRVHFELLAQKYPDQAKTHYGIIIAVRRKPHEIARRLLRILNQVTADEMENQVRYI
jgi:uncharacterized protein DUF5615